MRKETSNTMKTTIAKDLLLLLFIFTLPSATTLENFSIKNNNCKGTEIPPNPYRIKTIVIDAGHGGRDAGCSGKNSQEKHIALNLALKLGKAITSSFPSINIIYTRQKDIFVPLYERAAIANRNNADLFISIHCNALRHKAHLVSGSETYVMGLHTADHNLEVARRENESILLEENYEQNYQGFDPNSDEGHIFLSMFQNAFLEQSILLAEKIESNIKSKAKRKSRGVKQAGFVVLKETTMPSVLIETGYLTNAKDEEFLLTDYGQTQMANAIFEAFIDYKEAVEIVSPTQELSSAISPPIAATSKSTLPRTSTNQTSKVGKPIPASLKISKTLSSVEPKEKIAETAPKAIKIENIVFKVQLAASPAKLETSNKKWSNIQYVEVRKEKSLYKYLTGNYANYEKALQRRNELLSEGFNGAFIVAYRDGERVALSEAKKEAE